MVIFHSYVKLPEGILPWVPKNLAKTWENGTLKIWEMIILPWVPKNVAKTWENGILFDLGDDHPRQKPCPTRCISKFVIVQKLPQKKSSWFVIVFCQFFRTCFFPKKFGEVGVSEVTYLSHLLEELRFASQASNKTWRARRPVDWLLVRIPKSLKKI